MDLLFFFDKGKAFFYLQFFFIYASAYCLGFPLSYAPVHLLKPKLCKKFTDQLFNSIFLNKLTQYLINFKNILKLKMYY